MKGKIFIGLFVLLFLNSLSSMAEIRMAKVFSDNMVLQRDQEVKIWGWAKPYEKIYISLQGKQYNGGADKSGEWSIQIPPTPAGGPYDLFIKGENTIHLRNILFGDIWICSGQSNMYFKVRAAKQAYAEINNANYDKIRLFQIEKDAYDSPKMDLSTGYWLTCDSESVQDFSAVAYFFGKELYEEIDVPIGLIHASWGGSKIEAWMDRATLQHIQGFQGVLNEIEHSPNYFSQLESTYKKNGGDLLVRAIYTQSEVFTIDGKLSENKFFFEEGWQDIRIPGYWEKSGLPGYNGTVWYRKLINIPAAFIDHDLELNLGWIDDYDFTFFNGKSIGKTFYKGTNRNYNVPKDLVQEGENEILICIYDNSGLGGFWGPHQIHMKPKGDEKELQLDLQGIWNIKPELEMHNLVFESNNPKPQERSIPTYLYNAMIAPLTNFAIKGVLWYQGESNAGNAGEYMELFPAMINGWRRAWNQGAFPFIFVQLPNYGFPDSQPNQSNWAEFREVQLKTLSVPNTGIAVTIDLGDEMNIHPINKQDVAKRLTLSALKIAYQKIEVYSGPLFDSMEIKNGKVYLSFTQTGSGLMVKDKFGYLKEFAIAGQDQKFVWAKGSVEGDKVVVYNENISEPVAVRYAWSNNPSQANLYNKEGLPASPFRTDNWIDQQK